MAWNQPGNGGNKDATHGKTKGERSGTPDLDEALRKFFAKLGSWK